MRNKSIDFFRYVFAIEICLWHFLGIRAYFNHGYLAVDFFFILSGLFLSKSVLKKSHPSVFDYTFIRVKRFYPKLALAVLPLFILAVIKILIVHTPEMISYQIQRILNEYLFIAGFATFKERLNGTLWYINVLIIDGGLLYGLMRLYYKNTIQVFLPLAIILIYTYILNLNDGNLHGGEDRAYPFINWGLLRGFAAMSVGIMLNEIIIRIQTFLEYHVKALDIIAFLCFLGIIVISIVKPNYDGYIIVFSCFIIMSCMTNNSIIHRLLKNLNVRWMGEMSLNLYLIHYPICTLCYTLFPRFDIPFYLIFVSYIVIVHIVAFIFGKLCKHLNI